jgi:L-serine deaminase
VDLQKEIAKMLDKYGEDVKSATKAVAVAVGKKAVQALKASNAYKDHAGKYRKSFKSQAIDASFKNEAGAVVYAAGIGGSIGHLIENGHMSRDGTKRINASPHWGDAETQAGEQFENELTRTIGGIS